MKRPVPAWPGRLIVLEGIDGAGKSEQTRRLAGTLRARRAPVVETREPTQGTFGRRYRAWARGETQLEPEDVLELFLRDRAEHVDSTILPGLRAGSIVLCDRYVASTRAYQTAAGIDPALLARRLAAYTVPEPDLVLWLRLPVREALGRLGDASRSRERFEHASFLERVDREYGLLGLTEVDAAASADEVEQTILARVEPIVAGLERADG